MDRFYSAQVRREEAEALRARLSSFVDDHEQQLFAAQQRLRQPTDATHWDRHHDVVTVQLSDTPHHTSVGAHHQPWQRRVHQQSSIADLLGSAAAAATTDPLLLRCVVSLASLNAEMAALSDEARRCYAPPLALVGDDNGNGYKDAAADRERAGHKAGEGVRRGSNHESTHSGRHSSVFASPSSVTYHAQGPADPLAEEELLHTAGALLPLLQDLWLWRQRVQDVVAHALSQFATIYHSGGRAKGGTGGAAPLAAVRLTSCWDCLGDLLAAVLLIDEVLQQNSSIRDSVAAMQRVLAQRMLDAQRDGLDADDEPQEVLRMLVRKLQADLLDCSLLASVAGQPFDQLLRASAAAASGRVASTSPPPLREHVSLCEEWAAVLTGRCTDFEAALASPRAVEHKSSLAALFGMCALMKAVFLSPPAPAAATPKPVAATTVGKLAMATLLQLSRRVVAWQSVVPLLPLQGIYVMCPLLWWRKAFPAELAAAAAGALKDGAGAEVRRSVTEACQTAASQFLPAVSEWTDQVDRWAAVEMPSVLRIDAPPCRHFVQRSVLLIQQGVALARTIQDGVVQLLLLHHHAEVPLTVPMVYGALQAVLLLQRIADAYHAKMGILATAHATLVQSIVYVLEKHLYSILTRTCSARSGGGGGGAATTASAAREQLLALQWALQLLHKPLTADTMACLSLLLDVALNRQELQESSTKAAAMTTEKERDDAFIALAQLTAVLAYQQTLSSITSAAFLFAHREAVYPLFIRYCYENTLAAISLPQVLAAFGDCRTLIMAARHVAAPAETLLREYAEFVRDCVHHELVQPLCTEIENQLRLRTHDVALGNSYRALRTLDGAFGRDLLRYTRLPPLRFLDGWMHLAAQIEHYLSTQFYNLNALMPNDWKTYEEMRNLARHTYHLHIEDGHLPSCILDQGLDVLAITENIQQFVAHYTYNMHEQAFIQHPALTPSKNLHVLNTRHIANSIRTHGTGVMNTAVNYVYKYLLQKMAVLSHFLHDDYVRSHLLKDARAVRQRTKEQQPIKYPLEQAEQLIREMDRLGVAQDGVSFLEKARQLISEMGNALGFMRIMRSGGLRAVAEAARFVPLPTAAATSVPLSTYVAAAQPQATPRGASDDDAGEEEEGEGRTPDSPGAGADVDADGAQELPHLRRSAVDAVANVDEVVRHMIEQLSDGSEYYPLLLDAIGRRLRRASAERYAHLQLLYLLVPALTNLHVANTIQEKEKLLKTYNEHGVFCDDGFAVGTTFLLALFAAREPFAALHWFENKKEHYLSQWRAVTNTLHDTDSRNSPEFGNLHLTAATMQTRLKEFTNLERAFTSSQRFFDTSAGAGETAPSTVPHGDDDDGRRRRRRRSTHDASADENEQESD